MRIFVFIFLISSWSFADNALIESKDINILSERDEVINQDLTTVETIKASVLNKKLDALNLRQEQFRPQIYTGLNDYYEAMNAQSSPYSTTTPTLFTIEKKYDSTDTYLEVGLLYYMRVRTFSTGAACSLEIEITGPSGSCTLAQAVFSKSSDNHQRIKMTSYTGYCLDLPKGTYDVSVKKYRGSLGGAYGPNQCDFFHSGYGTNNIKIIEAIK